MPQPWSTALLSGLGFWGQGTCRAHSGGCRQSWGKNLTLGHTHRTQQGTCAGCLWTPHAAWEAHSWQPKAMKCCGSKPLLKSQIIYYMSTAPTRRGSSSLNLFHSDTPGELHLYGTQVKCSTEGWMTHSEMQSEKNSKECKALLGKPLESSSIAHPGIKCLFETSQLTQSLPVNAFFFLHTVNKFVLIPPPCMIAVY